MEEIWKDVIGYEGIYEVSNLGRVKSFDKKIGGKVGLRFIKGRILKNHISDCGYLQVGLYKNSIRKIYKIHQLVSICFLNHTIDGNNIVVDHIDGDKLNNNVNNLHLVTHRENLSTCFRKNNDVFTSNYVGVSWRKSNSKWCSQITINNKKVHLGYFNTEMEASDKYQEKLKEIKNG